MVIQCDIYSIVGKMVGGGGGPRRNKPKLILRNHLLPLNSNGQALTSSNLSTERPGVLSMNFYKILKILYFSEFSSASLPH